MTERIYLNAPYSEKDAVKGLGAQWDGDHRGWWVDANAPNLSKFQKWIPRKYRTSTVPPYLTSEMVPSPTWYTNLRSLLPTQEWDRIRKDCYEAAGWHCHVSGRKGEKWPVECNEQWQYLHDPNSPEKGTQKLIRLAALCPKCHSVKHLGKANLDGRLDETLHHLA